MDLSPPPRFSPQCLMWPSNDSASSFSYQDQVHFIQPSHLTSRTSGPIACHRHKSASSHRCTEHASAAKCSNSARSLKPQSRLRSHACEKC